ncbi:excisionase family DNA-binding protein [Coleofasciculus sp. H7-2]|uniref:excisionase family DNA-binding protein n=1 Tax=Coleofasciculus sp. H7-2 TaxID=3351545 RepID=UPI00366A956E
MTIPASQNFRPILPTEEDATQAQASSQILASLQNNQPYRTIKVMQDETKGETVTIPEAVFDLLVEILAQMAQGNTVKLTPITKELEVYQAAEILGVSREYLWGLLDSGKIPYTIVGNTRQMRFQDVMDYKNRAYEESMKALDELAAQAQELKMGS